MHEKIAILTINDIDNYGNRLQNYALVQLLGGKDTCTTIHLDIYRYSIFKYYIRPFSTVLRMIKASISQNHKLYWKRISKAKQFTTRYASNNIFSLTAYKGLKVRGNNQLKTVVIGSDQVWNYEWLSKEDLSLRLGSFASSDVPTISYAASIGVSRIDGSVGPVFREYLPRLKAISVREDRARELIKEVADLNAAVVLDPTLMITSKEWLKITENFVSGDDRYVLTYFIGKPSAAQERTIQEYATAHNCRVRRMLDLRDPETYVSGPQDFVELFSKSEYVFTDSYHACCFSILFHKQFTVFNRDGMKGSMNSRMETLFRLFDLNAVVMDDGLAPVIDYDKVDRLLERHRAESQAWLDKAMEIE
ncbi:polysaccharide pyruvyl transferase family protein [Bifidobacterium eulemuris]|uniref:Polysaccharide pyruvyl transferase n=1 Tax=Bifidobacterium eulemuris TaxID=1765219 RepID=A0A261GAV4_9BIFI|nr:polysaccharide pyruvyl transferase family protein [Bifidobacterium eulemuris]OZG68549.1 Polysaccharide pyruvyl transferase [Bifidobacterium eulemuris]QOL32679.1 polysaccharide pyruvyl transferase family protein [Bifidobacterium eulemuris]